MRRISKNEYLLGFACIVVLLALVRLIFPSVARPVRVTAGQGGADSTVVADGLRRDQTAHPPVLERQKGETGQTSFVAIVGNRVASVAKGLHDAAEIRRQAPANAMKSTNFVDGKGQLVKHPIMSVPSYSAAFPDSNDVQLSAARKYGVSPVADRAEAEQRKMELVYVGSSPFYTVDELYSSIPYLVPRAAVLLHDIGRNFFDSLQVKGVPLHHFVVTSVLRSQADVRKLRGHNKNATENSCHLYGTTFDIGYNRYRRVADPEGYQPAPVRNDSLKWVLSEVLNDLRQQGRCYVKYEVKQGCYHITVR